MLPTAEIVHVIDGTRLIDAESYERSLDTEGRCPLEPGYYVVVWPDDIATPRYDRHATFFGPLLSRDEACALLDRHCDAGHPG